MFAKKKRDWWAILVIGLLGLTALIKFLSLFKPANLLSQTDPILGVHLWLVVLVAATFETGICIFLILIRDESKQALIVFSFAVIILAYRAAFYTSGTHFCPCLGNAVYWWPWLGTHENQVLITIALWLLLTSLMKLTQSKLKNFAAKINIDSVFLAITVPILIISLFIAWARPWRFPSFGPDEGVEFSKMLLILNRPADAALFSNTPGWFYASFFALIFSGTGFYVWIPRLMTLAIMAGAWIVLPRLLPGKITWPKSILAFVLFCFWPSVTYALASASPALSALGLTIIGVGFLPISNETGKGWRFVASFIVLVFALCFDVSVAIAFPAVTIWLFHNRVKQSSAFSSKTQFNIHSDKPRAVCIWREIIFAIMFFLVTAFILFRDVTNSLMTIHFEFNLVRKTSDFTSSLLDLLATPGSLLGAIGGVILLIRQRLFPFVQFFLALVAATLLVHFLLPFWPDFMLYMGFPVAILGALGIGGLLDLGLHESDASLIDEHTVNPTSKSFLICIFAVSLWLGFESPNAPRELSSIGSAALYSKGMIGILDDYQGQVKWIYTRDCNLAVSANFILPPAIIESVQYQFISGPEKVASTLNTVKKYNCEILILQKDELDEKGWPSFIKDGYTNIWSNGYEAIFIAKRLKIQLYPTPEELLKI